jgi:hypothetical protein
LHAIAAGLAMRDDDVKEVIGKRQCDAPKPANTAKSVTT